MEISSFKFNCFHHPSQQFSTGPRGPSASSLRHRKVDSLFAFQSSSSGTRPEPQRAYIQWTSSSCSCTSGPHELQNRTVRAYKRQTMNQNNLTLQYSPPIKNRQSSVQLLPLIFLSNSCLTAFPPATFSAPFSVMYVILISSIPISCRIATRVAFSTSFVFSMSPCGELQKIGMRIVRKRSHNQRHWITYYGAGIHPILGPGTTAGRTILPAALFAARGSAWLLKNTIKYSTHMRERKFGTKQQAPASDQIEFPRRQAACQSRRRVCHFRTYDP